MEIEKFKNSLIDIRIIIEEIEKIEINERSITKRLKK